MKWNMKTTYFEDKMSWWFTKSVMKILSKSLARYTTKLSRRTYVKNISRYREWQDETFSKKIREYFSENDTVENDSKCEQFMI